MREVFRNRNALLYILAQCLSIIGSSSLWLAVGIWVRVITGSNAQAGLVFFAFMAGTLMGPLWGHLIDRVPRRPILVTANLFSAAYILALLAVGGESDLWLVYVVLFVYGSLNSLFDAGQTALMPAFLPDDQLPDANALLQTCRLALRMVTPLIGAGMFSAWGAESVVTLDCATFLIAATAVLLLRMEERPPRRTGQSSWKTEVATGFRYLIGRPDLRRMLIAISVAMAVWGIFESLLFAVIGDGLDRSPTFVGVLTTVQGLGSVLSGPAAGHAVKRLGETVTTALALGAFAVGCALLVPSSTVAVLAGVLLVGFGLPWVMVGFTTLLQRRTPSELLGRTYAAFDVLTNTPQMLSVAYGAAMVAYIDYRLILLAMTVVFAASAVYLAAGGSAADPDDDPPADPAGALDRHDRLTEGRRG
ncbi:MFS transporter [Actinomadura roseirufa]|uniref:MFS transporter n=1 Tax=Actinomadura roseirufa TaxID=2094049 RepID=UPI0010412F4B|nr:MFS transporter [Actinomadura roseirufa]